MLGWEQMKLEAAAQKLIMGGSTPGGHWRHLPSFTLPDAPRAAGVIALGVAQASGFLKSSLGGSNVQPRLRDAGLDGGQDSARQWKPGEGWAAVQSG